MNHHFNNPVRGRLNAWILQVSDSTGHKAHRRWKQQLFEDLPDSFVELGPGTGANFRYYRRGAIVIAVEPNRRMSHRLYRNAEKYGINIALKEYSAEELALDDNSTEAVVSTQVLCTAGDLSKVLNEVYRVLSPRGRFIFLEHVAAPRGTILRRFQDLNLVSCSWRWFFEGCNLNYEIDTAISTAGFSITKLERYEVKTLLPVPIRHFIAGIAIKRRIEDSSIR